MDHEGTTRTDGPDSVNVRLRVTESGGKEQPPSRDPNLNLSGLTDRRTRYRNGEYWRRAHFFRATHVSLWYMEQNWPWRINPSPIGG